MDAMGLPPLKDISQEALDAMLNPETGLPDQIRPLLRAKLRMPPETPISPAATNSPTAAASTNAPAARPPAE